MDDAGGGKAWALKGLASERRRTVEALVLAQANADGERRKEKEKAKIVYNNKIILILYYI